LIGHLKAPSWAAGMAGSGWNPWLHGRARRRGEEGDKTDGRGPCFSEGRERKRRARRAQTKEENIFCENTKGMQARWAGCVGRRPVSKAGRLGSVELGRIPGEDSSKFWFFEFQNFLELDRTWRNFTRRFRRNLDMRILLKFF
jgi:hypothetical protein